MNDRITNSPVADVFIIWAKADDADNRICGFILERGMDGLTTPTIEGKFSLRASVTGQIAMSNVEVPADNLLPNVTGLKVCIRDGNRNKPNEQNKLELQCGKDEKEPK